MVARAMAPVTAGNVVKDNEQSVRNLEAHLEAGWRIAERGGWLWRDGESPRPDPVAAFVRD